MDEAIEPHYERSALVTIDVQRDTLDGQPLEVPGTSEVVPTIARLCRAYRTAGQPIVHVVRLYRADGSNAEPVRRTLVAGAVPVLRPGTPGRLLAPGLAPRPDTEFHDEVLLEGGIQELGPDEVILYKPRWGAFYETALEGHLRRLDVDTLVVTGCNFPNCPRASVVEASERDLRVVVVADGVSGLDPAARHDLRGIGAVVAEAGAVEGALLGARTT